MDNNKKINAVHQLIRLFIQSTFNEENKHLASPLLALLFRLETSYSLSSRDYINSCKLYGNWLKVSYLTKDYSMRDIPLGFWLSFDSAPMLLLEIVSILKGSNIKQNDKDLVFRLAISILNCYKVITVPTEPNFHSIVANFDGDDTVFNRFDFPKIFKRMNILAEDVNNKLKEEVISSKWHFSSASGPNGHAVWSSHLDAASIHNDENLKSNLDSFCRLLNMDHIMNALEHCKFETSLLGSDKEFKLLNSKIHYIYEKGNKCRIIAIADYFTQEALTPLHNIIANINRNIANDSTFNQDKGYDNILELSAMSGVKLYSFDLSAATDRLPLRLQKLIIANLFSNELADLWGALLVNRVYQDRNGYGLVYKVGQPMGTKTSFPMLALTHHVIVQQASINAGLPSFSNYQILGDDIVIGNEFVAKEYQKLISDLGVSINLNKSIIPGIISNGAEFASRLCIGGRELSPLPVKLMAKTYIDGTFAGDLQNDLVKRGYLSASNIWAFFSSFLRDVELLGLVRLNGIPLEISGLLQRFPNSDASDLNYETWATAYGITKDDLVNFFTYTVVMDQLSKLDKLLKSSNTTLSSMLSWCMDSGYIPLSVSNGQMNLSDFMTDYMVRSDKTLFHPAQQIARSESNRLSAILTQFIMAPSDMKDYLRKGMIDSLKLRLDEQFQRKPDMNSAYTLTYRRILDKSLRLSLNCSQSMSKTVRTSQNIMEMGQIWNLNVGIGKPFNVSPVMIRSTFGNIESTNRIKALSSGMTLSNALNSITPEERRKFNPMNRLTSS